MRLQKGYGGRSGMRNLGEWRLVVRFPRRASSVSWGGGLVCEELKRKKVKVTGAQESIPLSRHVEAYMASGRYFMWTVT